MTTTTVLNEAEHFQKLSEAIERGDEAEQARLMSDAALATGEVEETPPEVPAPAEGNTEQPIETPPEGAGEKVETPPDEDWISSLPEDVQAKVKEATERNAALQAELAQRQHQSRSDSGRIRAYQQKLAELEKAKTETQPAPSSPKDDPGLAGLEALAADDPALAEALKAYAKQVEDRASAAAKQVVESVLRPQQEAQFHDYVSEQQRIVRSTIPNVDEVVSHPHFQTWLANSSELVQKLVASPKAEDAFHAMKLYEAQLRVEFPEETQVAAPSQTATPAVTTTADKLAGARAARPQAPASKSEARVATLAPEQDLDALFKQDYEKLAKQFGSY